MNLKELFKILDLDISHLDPKLLSMQILYFYFIIKDWVINNYIRNTYLYEDLINYKDSIYKIDDLSELQYILSSYIALIEKVSNVIRNEKCIEYIKCLKLNDTYFYSIYITTLNNIYMLYLNLIIDNFY